MAGSLRPSVPARREPPPPDAELTATGGGPRVPVRPNPSGAQEAQPWPATPCPDRCTTSVSPPGSAARSPTPSRSTPPRRRPAATRHRRRRQRRLGPVDAGQRRRDRRAPGRQRRPARRQQGPRRPAEGRRRHVGGQDRAHRGRARRHRLLPGARQDRLPGRRHPSKRGTKPSSGRAPTSPPPSRGWTSCSGSSRRSPGRSSWSAPTPGSSSGPPRCSAGSRRRVHLSTAVPGAAPR